MNPRVSVCIPTYNSDKYLAESIESVLEQTYSDYEILIIDNCSTDNSREIIKKYAGKDRRIIYTFNEKNLGMVNNWNLCLTLAHGEYIKFLFSDDLLTSNRALEEMTSILAENQNVSLVAASRYVIDEDSNIIKTLSEYRGSSKYAGAVIINDCLMEQKNQIGEPSVVMFRKTAAERGFDPRYEQIVDLEMWFHLLEQGDFYYIDKPLCSFRVHSSQQTQLNIKNKRHINDAYLLLSDYSNKPYIRSSKIEKQYMYYVPAYGVWKSYKKHKIISRKEAEDKIINQYKLGRWKLLILHPFYKLFKFYFKLKRNKIS